MLILRRKRNEFHVVFTTKNHFPLPANKKKLEKRVGMLECLARKNYTGIQLLEKLASLGIMGALLKALHHHGTMVSGGLGRSLIGFI